MFEKEAEKYAENNAYKYASDYITCQEAYKDGAEFGYNKANEWHKQDIDDIYDFISKDWSFKYFICIMKDKSLVTATGICDEDYSGGVSTYLDFDHDDEKYSSEDIMWWKEITPPKEIEENDRWSRL